MNEERASEYGGYGSEPATPLEYLERIIASLPPGDPTRSELIDLRSNFAEQEEMITEARHTIEKLDEVIVGRDLVEEFARDGEFAGGETLFADLFLNLRQLFIEHVAK